MARFLFGVGEGGGGGYKVENSVISEGGILNLVWLYYSFPRVT